MSLRQRMLLITGLLFVGTAGLLFLYTQTILVASYRALEEQATEVSVHRVVNLIAAQLDQLESTAADWAYWDDTYAFAQDNDPAFIDANLTLEAWTNLGLNLAVITDRSGEVLYGAAIDTEQGEITALPAEVLEQLKPDGRLLDHPDEDHSVRGILRTDRAPLLAASRPILTSRVTGPRQGTLVFGRYLDEALIETLSLTLDTSISIFAAADAAAPDDVTLAISRLGPQQRVWVQPLAADQVAGYAWLYDLAGSPAYVVRADSSRQLYRQGEQSVSYFMVSLLGTGAVFTLVMTLLLERTVLSRIRALQRAVSRVRATQDLDTPIPVAGRDEMGELGAGVREMLQQLALSREMLEGANQELERRVAERTADLTAANEQLQIEVAERRQVEAQLEQARDRALEALQLRAQIVANVSHEARTPLTVIKLKGDLLRGERYGPLTPRQKEALETLALSTRQLQDFMDNLLTESLSGRNRLVLQPERFMPVEVARQVLDEFTPLARRKSLELSLDVAENAPPEVEADVVRVKQVLRNLVSNAINFTASGQVRIRIVCQDDTRWALQVADTGSGIAPEHRERVFDPFWQVDGSPARQENYGVGLGLSIVRQLVTMMGGTVVIGPNAQAASGTVVTVLLPVAPSTG